MPLPNLGRSIVLRSEVTTLGPKGPTLYLAPIHIGVVLTLLAWGSSVLT